jgi:phosphoglucosamine mutase
MGKLFGTSGIRGLYGKEISDSLVQGVIKSFAYWLGEGKTVCVGRDTRKSGPELEEKIVEALRENGLNAVRLGVVPSPAVYYLSRELGFDAGIMVTASHNPPEYNGLKFCNSRGMAVDQQKIEEGYFNPPDYSPPKKGGEREVDGAQEFFSRLEKKCPKPAKPLKLVVDCACGPNSEHMPGFLRTQGHEVLEKNCVPDVTKCDRPLEPKPGTLQNTVEFLKENGADAGLCFDGDNDRVVFLDRNGVLGFQEANAAIASIMVEESDSEKKEVVGSVETGRLVEEAVKRAGGSLHRTIVGDTFIARTVKERGALLGLEECGHYLVPEIGFFSSTVYPAALLLAKRDINNVRQEFSSLPKTFFAKERIGCPNERKKAVMEFAASRLRELGGRATDIDGVRVDWDDAWVLVRPSGTEPYMKVSGEAVTQARLDELVTKGKKFVEEALKQ